VPRRSRGFTLIEVLVALTLGGALVLAAHAVFGGASDAAAALTQRRTAHDAQMAGRAAISRAVASLDPASPGAVGFDGSEHRMRFSTRERDARGRLVLRTLTVAMQDGRLIAAADTAVIAALPDVEEAAFDYLLTAGADARWVAGWHSPVSAPLAVRLRVQRTAGAVDTLLLAIGPRG
jgi:prepilin-type N-terminal cleavage/methylation domain-containing protein